MCTGLLTQISNMPLSAFPNNSFLSFFFSIFLFPPNKDSPGWDSGRTNGFVNGYHDNRTNGGFGGRGPPRNDRGGRGAYRGNRGGGSFNQPLQNAGGKNLLSLKISSCSPSCSVVFHCKVYPPPPLIFNTVYLLCINCKLLFAILTLSLC